MLTQSRLLDPRIVLACLARDLAVPPFAMSAESLAALWQIEVLRLTCDLPAGMDDHPELSVRVRGAFGRQLHAQSPRRTATGAERPAAWDVLAAPIGQLATGIEVPKPVVLRAAASGPLLIIEMRILGAGAGWFDEAASALITALEQGIALRAEGRLRTAVQIRDMEERRITGVAFPSNPTTARLRFYSPVVARQKNRFVEDPRAILRGTLRRVASLARWHATKIVADWQALEQAVEMIALDDTDLVPYRWTRHSIRQGNVAIPAAGWLGTLGLSGNLAPLAPYLALAETMNTGGQASLGLGWFDLAIA